MLDAGLVTAKFEDRSRTCHGVAAKQRSRIPHPPDRTTETRRTQIIYTESRLEPHPPGTSGRRAVAKGVRCREIVTGRSLNTIQRFRWEREELFFFESSLSKKLATGHC